MTDVVLAAGGAGWEAAVLAEVERAPGLRLTRRCVDVAELLAVSPHGIAEFALVAAGLPGLDADVVHRVERAGVRVVGVGDSARCEALGMTATAEPGRLAEQLAAVSYAAPVPVDSPGRLVAIWGPTGAPGRSSVAISLAAAWAATEHDVVLIDADTYGGSIAQTLAVLDETSGLLAACRAANAGDDRLVEALVEIEPGLRLLTGIPRAEMWTQLRPGALERVLGAVRRRADVTIVDCGFGLEAGEPVAGGRDRVARHVLADADVVVAVGRADPVGLSRLVRGVHDVTDVAGVDPTVVVNRTDPSAGWSAEEIARTVRRLTGHEVSAFLPRDETTLDRAMMRGVLPRARAPASPFVRAVDDLAARLGAAAATAPAG